MTHAILIQMSPDDLQRLIDERLDVAIRRIEEAKADELLTRSQAARILGKSVQTIRRMELRGDLTPVNVSGHPKYSRNSIVALRAKCPKTPNF